MGFSHGVVVIEMDSMPPQPGDDLEPEIDRFLRVVRHLADASQWERLLEVARRRMEQSPADEVAHRAAALALIRLRRGSEAGIHVDRLLKEDPEHAFHHELAAQVAMQSCDFRLAEEHLKTGLALDPDKSALHFLTVSVKSALGDPAEARRHARRLQELEGDNAQSWLSQDVALEGTPPRCPIYSRTNPGVGKSFGSCSRAGLFALAGGPPAVAPGAARCGAAMALQGDGGRSPEQAPCRRLAGGLREKPSAVSLPFLSLAFLAAGEKVFFGASCAPGHLASCPGA